jgi:uncharacterized protein (DUF697 family)
MNKKKLPKAIVWTAKDMRDATSGGERQETPNPAVLEEPAAARASAAQPGNVIEMVPKTDATPAAPTAAAQATPAPDGAALARRRLAARAIVERHANLSAVGGIIPLPILNIAGITAIVVRMVRMLSKLYGVPFERNRARATVIGLMGGVMPTGLATVASSTLVLFLPGTNLIGLAVSSVTASACARGIGQMFIEHFENGSTLIDFPSAVLR